MELKGVVTNCNNEVVKDALKRAGYKLRPNKVAWPRKIGQGIVLVDCTKQPCHNALALR